MKVTERIQGKAIRAEMLDPGDVCVYADASYLVIDKGSVNVGNDQGVLAVNLKHDMLEYIDRTLMVRVVSAEIIVGSYIEPEKKLEEEKKDPMDYVEHIVPSVELIKPLASEEVEPVNPGVEHITPEADLEEGGGEI